MGWLAEVVVGVLIALVVVAVVVGTGCLGVLGLVGALGRRGVPVLFSAEGATEAAGKVNKVYKLS